jgi:hypothetical protein
MANQISDAGAEKLGQALSSGKAPNSDWVE